LTVTGEAYVVPVAVYVSVVAPVALVVPAPTCPDNASVPAGSDPTPLTVMVDVLGGALRLMVVADVL
jgi:hypothetical protein